MGQIASRDFDMEEKNVKSSTKDEAEAARVAQGQRSEMAALYAPVLKQMGTVETVLKSELQSDTPFVDQLLQHSWLLGGKRMRPVLLLLSGMAAGQDELARSQSEGESEDESESALVWMAAAVEMIHTATLVHDDVLDKADLRRHQPTANAKWGNRVSVLLGDYLFTHAFHVASKSGSAEALGMLAASSNLVCAGEMKQNYHAGNFEMQQSVYFEIISQKTAELCASSCGIGALIVGAAPETVADFEQYGRDLGIAFQIIDDILDLVGTETNVGKTLGTDLFNAKLTLPVIHCLETLKGEQRQAFLSVLTEGKDHQAAIEWMNKTESIDYARNVAQKHATSAKEFAGRLERSPASESLVGIAQFILERTH